MHPVLARSTPPPHLRLLAALELSKGGSALLAVLLLSLPWELTGMPAQGPLAAFARWVRTPHATLAWTLAGYATMRLIEGTGLWAGYRWARWLNIAGYASAIPLEVWHLFAEPRWWTGPLLALNVGVVAVLVVARVRP